VFEEERRAMAQALWEGGYVRSEAVLKAMQVVPRHIFLPRVYWPQAYQDKPLPTAFGQTTSAPSMIAITCELLLPFKLLYEVGGGTGYLAAVCAQASGSGEVLTTEIIPALAVEASRNFDELGLSGRVHVLATDGASAVPLHVKPDAVVVSAAAPDIPEPLLKALAEGGKMVIPVGREVQELTLVRKEGGRFTTIPLLPCVYVPLLGVEGTRF